MERILTPCDRDMTAALQKAIDDCFLANGGRVVLTAGLYNCGGIRLRSNVTLYLSAGAVLKGTRVPEDYAFPENDQLEPFPKEYLSDAVWVHPKKRINADHITKAGSRWNHALIRLVHAKNAAIIGEPGSCIDGSDCYDEIGEEHYRGPHGISFHYCEDLYFSGYTIENTGNWAHNGYASKNVRFSDVTVKGGHDGIHISICDDITIEKCEFYTGDDCIAGFDNERIVVRNCIMNTACSAFRFGGLDVLIENCRCFGPAKYFFRGSLSLEDKISGNPVPQTGRKTMLSFFTYYSDFTLPVRHLPRNIVVRNCHTTATERFLLYDFSGRQTWQLNKPMSSISFENIVAEEIAMPLDAYGDPKVKVSVELKDCRIGFAAPVPAAIRAGNYQKIVSENLTLENVNGPLVLSYGGEGEIEMSNTTGVQAAIAVSDASYEAKVI